MSSAKKTTAAAKQAGQDKKPGKSGKTGATAGKPKKIPAAREAEQAPAAENAKQLTAGAGGWLPAKSASHELARKTAAAPVKSEARLPVKKENALPAMRMEASPQALAPVSSNLETNPYLPEIATVLERIQDTAQIATLRLALDDQEKMRAFSFKPGQVGQLSVFGAGEATFVINSPPSQKEYIQMSVMKAGEVTAAIHKLSPGDKVGLRAPLGKGFPHEKWRGKDVFFIGGGIGMAPIRTIMLHLLDSPEEYGKISLLYGARSPKDMAYSYELDAWNEKLELTLTIDAPFDGWRRRIGLIPNVLLELAPSPENAVAVLCGPPIMIRFTLQALRKLAFPDEHIFTTLEKRMKCGIGICGRCNIGHKYVCVDGPVFSLAELGELPDEL